MTPGSEEEMAMFVVNFHFRPCDYYALTLSERNAIIEAFNKSKR